MNHKTMFSDYRGIKLQIQNKKINYHIVKNQIIHTKKKIIVKIRNISNRITKTCHNLYAAAKAMLR